MIDFCLKFTIIEIISKFFVVEFHFKPKGGKKMATGLKCPKCGKNTLSCSYNGDVGGVDYLDEYQATCSSCGYEKIEHVSGGSPMGWNDFTKCPFCGI